MIYIEKLKTKRCHCGVIMTGQTLTGVGAKDFEELRLLMDAANYLLNFSCFTPTLPPRILYGKESEKG